MTPRLLACLASLVLGLSACRDPVASAVGVATVDPVGLQQWLRRARPPTLIDVRERADYEAGHLPGARSVPWDGLAAFLASPRAAGSLVLVCTHGRLSVRAARLALGAGHHEVFSLSGGTEGWREAGLPLEFGPDPGVAPNPVPGGVAGAAPAPAIAPDSASGTVSGAGASAVPKLVLPGEPAAASASPQGAP